jgi:hypothetical protein
MLRRTVAHIEASPDFDLSVADIAQTAYITPPAVQLPFPRHRDTTPMAYLLRAAYGVLPGHTPRC